jgi:uncharacterized protein YgiM (DUF1202 family)
MIEYTVKVYEDGSKYWYLNGKYHREDGPAVEYANGDKYWYLNGEYHREDGPAIEYANGNKYWYLNGKYHREDGPACEYANGTKSWFLNDVNLTESEFNSKMNPAKELSVADIERLLGHRIKIVK